MLRCLYPRCRRKATAHNTIRTQDGKKFLVPCCGEHEEVAA